ncbi:hypothetical protein TanjilG_27988 [Lupinus angustifolius]|uniref:RING-type domain-containing protein n=1 Tax=Lupinus angustifolius TaxID=3871 RepID=A0A4P1RGC3_LUPAN|nr:PREDICTED: BOI-related E3 ubiquitin-protein ligase 1 isoform X2 [Lupinus angustifolius]OIW10237.1 hypothetical protein TanjilG_27988 [Lupinus angustifolius]
MAVESPHVNLLSSQLLINNNNSDIMMKPNYHIHNHEIDGVMPMAPSTMHDSYFFPLYQQSSFCNQIPTSFNKSESGLTYHHQIPVTRKRSRDSITDSNVLLISQKNKLSSLNHQPSLQNQHFFLLHLHNQKFEIDRFIAEHTEKIRMELEEHRVRGYRKLLSVIQEAVEKKVKEKDEEIDRMVNLNWVLQEKVKSLSAENQIWRDLAQTNEATVISLRTNLEQVLAAAQISEDHRDDDAESSCGSNYVEACGGDAVVGRMCQNCGVSESIVLLLPCRHLCLCTVCGSTTRNCPLCHSGINASVHVNFDY